MNKLELRLKQLNKLAGKVLRPAVTALIPAPLGVIIYLIIIMIVDSHSEQAFRSFLDREGIIHGFLTLVMFAYLVVGIQSIIYGLLMEFIINPLVKRHLYVALFSMLCGGLSAFIIDKDILFVITGIVVGLMVGLFNRWMYLRYRAKIAQQSVIDPQAITETVYFISFKALIKNRDTKQINRLVLTALLPVPLAVLIPAFFILIWQILSVSGFDAVLSTIKGAAIITLMAYLLVGLQSIIFSLLLELVVNPNIHRLDELRFSHGLLGFLGGLFGMAFQFNLFMAAYGVLIGLIAGEINRRMYMRDHAKPNG